MSWERYCEFCRTAEGWASIEESMKNQQLTEADRAKEFENKDVSVAAEREQGIEIYRTLRALNHTEFVGYMKRKPGSKMPSVPTLMVRYHSDLLPRNM